METLKKNVFISDDCMEQLENEYYTEGASDPLNGLGENPEMYYRLQETVFADTIPINNTVNTGTANDPTTEYTFIDKIVVEKNPRNKYRKFHMDIGSNLTCPQPNCNRAFKSRTLLKAHIRKVHCAVCVCVCELCGYTCPAKHLLVRHMAVHETRKVECPVCKKMLSARTSLSVHLRSHTNTRAHECKVYHKRFLRRATLTNHVKFVHRQGDLPCEKCCKRFPTRTLHANHTCVAKTESTRKAAVK